MIQQARIANRILATIPPKQCRRLEALPLVQGEGNALRMDAAPIRVEFNRNPALQDALYRYTYALMAQISQTAACNRF